MEFEFSNRINNAQASAVREILKMMNDPEMISFGGGNPASESFPVEALKTISQDIMTNHPRSVLEYGITEGDKNLIKEALKFFGRHEHIQNENDGVMITSGSQQIMDFLAKSLCNEGDVVIAEKPTFLGALNSFKSNGAIIKEIDLMEDGMDLQQLEEALSAPVKPKFIYIIPNFQNPMGICTSLEKRKAILALAKKYQVAILEDNPYGDLRFSGEHIPSIKSMDHDGIVIYAASLSKIIAPGMRVALMVGNKDVVNKCVVCKQVNDVHTNAWAQAVMSRFLKETDMDQHLASLQDIYRQKCQLMLDEMEKHFDSSVQWTKPEGGMFIWATLPEKIDMQEFVKAAVAKKVAVVPGNAFYANTDAPCNSMRMNFSMPSKEDIIKGISILGELIEERLNA